MMKRENINFKPENKLEELLVEIHSNPAMQEEFNKKLLESDLVVFATGEMEIDENNRTKGDSTIWIKDVSYKDKTATLIFTSLNRAASFLHQTSSMEPNEPYIEMNGSILLKSIIERKNKLDLIILNSKSPYELHATPQKIAKILSKSVNEKP